MHKNGSVLYCKSDMHVRPMRFSIFCTPTDSSDKTPLVCSTILLCLFASNYDINGSRPNYSSVSSNKIKYSTIYLNRHLKGIGKSNELGEVTNWANRRKLYHRSCYTLS